MTEPVKSEDVIEFIFNRSDWRKALVEESETTARRLSTAYTRLLPTMRTLMRDVGKEIAEREAQGLDVSPTMVQDMKSFSQFYVGAQFELRGFSQVLDYEMQNGQTQGILIGVDAAQEMTAKSAPYYVRQLLGEAWVSPDPRAIENAVNYMDGAPMREALKKFPTQGADFWADTVISYIAMGKSPRLLGEHMERYWGVPYGWGDNMARTVQLYSYRTASHAAYASNPRILDGWMWQAALDKRTCISCISQHGKIFPLSAILNDHHRGRCTPVPIVKGTTWAKGVKTGREWVETMPEKAQRDAFGNGKLYEAWKRGDIGWDDVSRPYDNAIYGEMLAVASARGLGLK